MGPAQSALQPPLLVLSWVGVVVLPLALQRTKGETSTTRYLPVAILWLGLGLLQVTVSLLNTGQFLGMGALVLGLALLLLHHATLWSSPRKPGAQLRRAALLAIPGVPLAVSAASGVEEVLGWSEAALVARWFKATTEGLPLLVSPRVSLSATFLLVYCVLIWLFPRDRGEAGDAEGEGPPEQDPPGRE